MEKGAQKVRTKMSAMARLIRNMFTTVCRWLVVITDNITLQYKLGMKNSVSIKFADPEITIKQTGNV